MKSIGTATIIALGEKGEQMSDRWLSDPNFCEGRLCVGDCDNCEVADEICEAETEEELRKEQRVE